MRKIIVPQEAVERHEETLGKALLEYLEYLSKGTVLTWGKKGKYQATTFCCRCYWKWVYNEFKDKKILTASPMVVLRFVKENIKRISLVGFYCHGKSEALHGDIVDVITALFAYDKLRSGNVLAKADVDGEGKVKIRWSKDKKNLKSWKGWSLAEYFRLLDIRCCPYCNAETVGLVKRADANGGENDSFSAIDHILPKETYPLLALSLCNLVPACYRCNSQFKGDKDFYKIKDWSPGSPLLALHPYVHDIHKWFHFKYEPTSVEGMFVREREGDDSSPLSMEKLNPLPKEMFKSLTKKQRIFYHNRVKEYLEAFELQNSYHDLYATEINELLSMLMICTPEFVSEMKRLYELTESDFDLLFLRSSLDSRDINRHRFAKLTIDLVRQFRQDVSRPQIISKWKKLWRQRETE